MEINVKGGFRKESEIMHDNMIDNVVGLDMTATGHRISRMIDLSGISDRDLGERMNCSVQAINKWRHGRSMPDLGNLFVLSRILNVKIDDFLVPITRGTPNVTYDIEAGQDPASVIHRFMAYYEKLKGMLVLN